MNPAVIGMVALLLSLIAISASSIPAHWATRVDPVTVLNQQ